MDQRLRETLSRVNWADRPSVDALALAAANAFDAALQRIAQMDPSVAGAFATSLGAGLPDHARNVIIVAANQHQQEQWQAEAKIVAQQDYDWRREADLVRQNMKYLLEQEWMRETHRRTRERGQFLEALAARAQRLTQQQAMAFGLALMDDARVPIAKKHAWEKAAVYDQIANVLYANAWSKATSPQSIRVLDDMQRMLSSDTLRAAIGADAQKDTQGKPTVVALGDVEKRLTTVVEGMPSLTAEQRVRVSQLVAQSVRAYAGANGLDAGIPADEVSLTQHTAGLRAELSNVLMNCLMDEELGLDPDAYESLVQQVEERIDGIRTNGSGHVAEFAAAHDAIRQTLQSYGINASGMRAEDAIANIGREALRDAKRIIKDPSKASQSDLGMMMAMAHTAERTINQIASMEPRPEPPKPDLSRWQAALQPLQQGRPTQPAFEPEPAGLEDPKPR